MRSKFVLTLAAAAGLTGCGKSEPKPATDSKAAPATAVAGDPKAAAGTKGAAAPAGDAAIPTAAGVEAGGIQHADDEGPAAVLSAMTGTVEVQRVGEATRTAAKANASLYPGDRVITGEGATATVTLADQSVVEVAEVSALAIASRDGTADPASATAVLAGLARFTVTARAPGEGPFRVYTPAGVIVTRGTVYGVGVAANGDARVGVESGTVDIVGLAAIDAAPISVTGGNSVALEAAGTVEAPVAWTTDDWGTWRDGAEAELDISAAVDAHSAELARLDAALAETYAELDASATAVADFEVAAAASAEANDTAAYTASLPDGAASIDASFALGGRAEALTWAHAGHATLATELYVRHPDVVAARWDIVGPRVDAAVLWPKRYEVTAESYFEPLRMQYYVHHPRGRAHAELVGVTVPTFYASVTAPAIEPARVRGRVKAKVWLPPVLEYEASARPVFVTAPSVRWHADVNVRPAPFRADVGWYVRPPTLRAHAMVGANVSGKHVSRIRVAAPQPRAALRASWRVPVGVKIKVGAPNLAAGMKARAGYRIGGGAGVGGGMAGGGAGVRGGGGVRAGAGVKIGVNVPPPPTVRIDVKAPVVRAGAKIRAGADAAADVRSRAGAGIQGGVRIKAPSIKIKAPSVKVKAKAKASGGFKIGG